MPTEAVICCWHLLAVHCRVSAGRADTVGSNSCDSTITRVQRPVAVGIQASHSEDAELETILLC